MGVHKNFLDVLEARREGGGGGVGVGVEIKCHITLFHKQIQLRVATKKEVEKPNFLVFDLGISNKKGRVSTLLGKSEKVREFVRESGKVRVI